MPGQRSGRAGPGAPLEVWGVAGHSLAVPVLLLGALPFSDGEEKALD